MGFKSIFIFLLLSGISEQAPQRWTRRENAARMSHQENGKLAISDYLSAEKDVQSDRPDDSTDENNTARQPFMEGRQARNDNDLTSGHEDPVKNGVFEDRDNEDREEASWRNDIPHEDKSDDDGSTGDGDQNNLSADELKHRAKLTLNKSNEDSVGRYIEKKTENGKAKDVITAGESDEQDSVASYIESNRNDHEENGVLRNEISKNDEDMPESTTSNDAEDGGDKADDTTIVANDEADSVAAYISQNAQPGETRDTITSTNHGNMAAEEEIDPVGPYIDQENGMPRNEITENEEKDNKEVKKTEEEDSVAAFIKQHSVEGETKDVITKPAEESNDSVAPYIRTLNDPGNEITENQDSPASAHTQDNDHSGNSQGEFSGDLDQTQDNLHSPKTQEILESLEEDLSNEIEPQLTDASRKRPAKTQTTYNNMPKDDNTSSYVVQPPHVVPDLQLYAPQYKYVDIENAVWKGAVCLDGSTPGYFYRAGSGNGTRNWIIYLQGGAWCDSVSDCYERSNSNLGSSLKFTYLVNAEGLLSKNINNNPDFYDWNVVYVPYCDGASYTGNRTNPIDFKERKIYFRGKRILSALMDDLLKHQLKAAEKVVFSGTSAGGLAVLLNADYIRSRIPSKVTHVWSLADSGVFMDVANMKRESPFSHSMQNVFTLHESFGSMNSKCASSQGKKNAWKCFFPKYFGAYIKSPLFLVNPLYDSWQLANIVGIHCAYHPAKCSKKDMPVLKAFRKQTLEALGPLLDSPNVGLFADACVDHGQIISSPKWNTIRVRNRSMSGMFARWSKNQESTKNCIDPLENDYPFNPTCVPHFKD